MLDKTLSLTPTRRDAPDLQATPGDEEATGDAFQRNGQGARLTTRRRGTAFGRAGAAATGTILAAAVDATAACDGVRVEMTNNELLCAAWGRNDTVSALVGTAVEQCNATVGSREQVSICDLSVLCNDPKTPAQRLFVQCMQGVFDAHSEPTPLRDKPWFIAIMCLVVLGIFGIIVFAWNRQGRNPRPHARPAATAPRRQLTETTTSHV